MVCSATYFVILHCKKSWRSSSIPASGDAGPIHTGVEQSFRHPWRKFYYKYRTFPTIFTSVELVRQSWKVSKALAGREPTPYRVTICHSTTAPHSLLISLGHAISNLTEHGRRSRSGSGSFSCCFGSIRSGRSTEEEFIRCPRRSKSPVSALLTGSKG